MLVITYNQSENSILSTSSTLIPNKPAAPPFAVPGAP
jgi:hypothetical protein